MENENMSQNNKLRFRRQFVFTSEPSQSFVHWQHLTIQDASFHIYAHPDLEMSWACNNDKDNELALLGFAIDPEYPNKRNIDIAKELIASAKSVESFSRQMARLAGRFVIILNLSSKIYLYHDACGQRSVFYANHDSNTYVSSQPLLFSKFFSLKPSEHYYVFNKSLHKSSDQEYWLPSGVTLYENIYHLIPNHYLDVVQGEQKRYWPDRVIVRRSLKDSAQRAADMLEKLISSANLRFDLALPLTAGWDSRTLLAASKKSVSDYYIYTLQLYEHTYNKTDITISKSISTKMGIEHHLIDCNVEIDREFYEFHKENVDLSHDRYAERVFAMLSKYPQDRMNVNANCSEIARCAYDKYRQHDAICSPYQLANLVPGWDELQFIVDQLDVWFESVKKLCIETNIDVLDLFYWEHRMGSWLAQVHLEEDIVYETFTPYNYRPLLETMLGAPVKYRINDRNFLFQRIIRYLWPELLKWPVNRLKKRKMDICKDFLHRIGIYEQVQHEYRRIKPFLKKKSIVA